MKKTIELNFKARGELYRSRSGMTLDGMLKAQKHAIREAQKCGVTKEEAVEWLTAGYGRK